MGVPAFYRWLSEKYPKIIENVLEDRVHVVPDSGSLRVPFDCTQPNPSGLECDNLYIDMNGIIHPCSHPEHGPQPSNEQEMYENVCRYVDRLFRAVRPRKTLYLAVDGVAPRAKMNQQRSRRFRSAQEAREHRDMEDQVRGTLREAGHNVSPTGDASSMPWDSNVITPGTKFMLDLSEYIRFYVRKRISTDKAWKSIRVIFSDASIPGEGEHKIMAHVRQQRSQPDYNPNLVHVLHGLDADLIMLALATHEVHFYILREEVLFGRKGIEEAEKKKEESGFADAQRQIDEAAGSAAMELLENKNKPLQRLSVPILRDYLAYEFRECERVPFREVSFERVVDDFVFLCFFVGNDFLPHLPSLDIRDGALDFLLNVYKRVLPSLGDYITSHGGEVNLSHVDVILAEVAGIEDHVFSMKHADELSQKKRKEEINARKKNLTLRGEAPLAEHLRGTEVGSAPVVRGKAARILEKGKDSTLSDSDGYLVALGGGYTSNQGKKRTKISTEANAQAAKELRSLMGDTNNQEQNELSVRNETNGCDIITDADTDRKIDVISVSDDVENEMFALSKDDEEVDDDDDAIDDDDDEEMGRIQAEKDEATRLLKIKVKEMEQNKLDKYAESVEDKVRLHEAGWKDRYYTDKCKADDVANHGGREHLFRSYVMGLCWIMKYYYDGCPSWKWYYPFHYAPFASDLRNIERFDKDCKSFELHEPFKPVEQLMAVLPEDSSHAIPKPARWLMSDPESPIIDFYPKDVPCDPNGKSMPWLWVVLLPFIEEDRLLDAMTPTMTKWSKQDLLSNARGLDDGYLFVHNLHSLAPLLCKVLKLSNKLTKLSIAEELGVMCTEFRGFLRQPLSNEIFLVEDDVVIPPPTSASRISRGSWDNLFSEPVEPNFALCAAFSEPSKLPHMSVVLPGANPLPSVLTDEDRSIRRPRLNRGGGTIANLGTGRDHQSHQSGYGSMNISSYERDLAQRTGRGNQMNQAGTRAWGAMEPTAKRPCYDNRNDAGHGIVNGGYHQQQAQHYRPGLFHPAGRSGAYDSRHGQGQIVGGYTQDMCNYGNPPLGYQMPVPSPAYQVPIPPLTYQVPIPPPAYQVPFLPPIHQLPTTEPRWQPPPSSAPPPPPQHGQYNPGTGQHYTHVSSYYHQGSHHNSQRNPNHQQSRSYPLPTRSVPQHGFNQAHQQQGQRFSFNRQGQQQNRQQQPNLGSRVDPNVMSSLRSQLANTLQQNRGGGGK